MSRWILILLLAAASPALAQSAVPLTPEEERTATAAMSRLRSPFTGSHTVDMCPSAGALRDSIRVAAASGQSTNQIVEDVIARHGEQLRLLPKRSGVGLWAWLLPPLVLVLGAGMVAAKLRGRQSVAGESSVEPEALSDADRARVASALRELEAGEVER